MWHEYPIQCNFQMQKNTIRRLRPTIEGLETEHLIVGFCFDHYASIPDVPDELRIRLQYSDERNRADVEHRLQTAVSVFLPNYILAEREWGTDIDDKHVLQGYEFGSRCAFLAWRLIENGRLSTQYFDLSIDLNSVPFQFQFHFNHGVMNSLGIPKVPNELSIHVVALMDATRSRSKRELINWLEQNLPEIHLA